MRMRMKKKSPDFFAALVMFLLLGCATTASALDYKEISVDDLAKNRSVYREKPPKNGFIIKGVITNNSPDGYLKIDNKIDVSLHGNNSCGKDHKCSFKGEQYNINDVRKCASDNRTITIYVNHYRGLDLYKGAWYLYADKIEGLMTMEEAAAYEAEKEAAKRKATEEKAEARRRMLENFIVKPSNPNFDPSQFSSVDLFKAVSVSKNLQRTSNETEAITNEALSSLMGISGKIAGIFVSDLVFVSQNGTDITFSSDDNAISQLMTIDQRSGLQVGQKVRVYYVVTRSPLLTWNIRAIERR